MAITDNYEIKSAAGTGNITVVVNWFTSSSETKCWGVRDADGDVQTNLSFSVDGTNITVTDPFSGAAWKAYVEREFEITQDLDSATVVSTTNIINQLDQQAKRLQEARTSSKNAFRTVKPVEAIPDPADNVGKTLVASATGFDFADDNYVKQSEIGTGLVFKSKWDASINSPNLYTINPSVGDFYIVSNAGTNAITGVSENWEISDRAIYSTSGWIRVGNTNATDLQGLILRVIGENGQIVETVNNATINIIDPDNIRVVDSVIEFNSGGGAGYLQIPNIFRKWAYTKSAWITANQTTTAMHLISNLTGETADHALTIEAGEIRGGHNGDWTSALSPVVQIDKNERVLITETFDTEDKLHSIYINGRLISQQSGGSIIPPIGNTDALLGLNIGSLGGANIFQGKMEDIRLYNRRLSDEEVKTLAQSYYNANIELLTDYDIIGLAGQSNIVGENDGPYLKGPGQADEFNADILALTRGRLWTYSAGNFTNSDGATHLAEEPLQHLWPPTQDRDRVGGGLNFAKLMLSNTYKKGRKIMLVPCGFPGAGFVTGGWTPGGPWYTDLVERVNFAISRYNGCLRAILWHQGEADAEGGSPWPANYAANLKDMVDSMRAEFVPDADSTDHIDTPFICGTMAPDYISTNADRLTVDAAHRDIANNIVNSGFVDLSLQTSVVGDPIHFDAPSLRNFGLLAHGVYESIRDY